MKRLMLICCLAAITFVSCQGPAVADKEYKHLKISGKGIKTQTAMLNELGKQGWEVVSIDTNVATTNPNGSSVDVGTTAINHLFKRLYLGEDAEADIAWEYRIVPAAGKGLKAQNKLLNSVGSDGWILVGSYTEIGPVKGRARNLWVVKTTAINYTLTQSTDASLAYIDDEGRARMEYKVIQIPVEKSMDHKTKLLNDLGAEKWELVSSYTVEGEVGVNRGSWRAGYVGTYAECYVFRRNALAEL